MRVKYGFYVLQYCMALNEESYFTHKIIFLQYKLKNDFIYIKSDILGRERIQLLL